MPYAISGTITINGNLVGPTTPSDRDGQHVEQGPGLRVRPHAGHHRGLDHAGGDGVQPQSGPRPVGFGRRRLGRAVTDGLIRNGAAQNRSTTEPFAQDLQFPTMPRTIRNRNRPAKQVGGQRWLNQHSMNRGSTRQSVLCAVSASPECLINRGELRRPRTGSPAHRSRPSGPGSTSSVRGEWFQCGISLNDPAVGD